MAFNKREFKASLKRHRIGLIVGSLVGFLAATYAASKGADLTSIALAGQGLLDNALGRTASLEVATYKLYAVLIFLGGTIGYFIDLMFFTRGRKVRGRSRRKRRFLI